jgi:hypothetical protein
MHRQPDRSELGEHSSKSRRWTGRISGASAHVPLLVSDGAVSSPGFHMSLFEQSYNSNLLHPVQTSRSFRTVSVRIVHSFWCRYVDTSLTLLTNSFQRGKFVALGQNACFTRQVRARTCSFRTPNSRPPHREFAQRASSGTKISLLLNFCPCLQVSKQISRYAPCWS